MMKSFLVGLLVIGLVAVLSFFGVLLFPFLLILGVLLRWVLGLALIIFTIWFIGKVTLIAIDLLKGREKKTQKQGEEPSLTG